MGLYRRLHWQMLRFRIPRRGVVHVGAHKGQERAAYKRCGFERQVWVEAHPETYKQLTENIAATPGPAADRVRAFNVACGSERGTAKMHIMAGSHGLANSLLEPAAHLELVPGVTPGGTIDVPVIPVDDLLRENGLKPRDYSMLSLDVQGFELEVLKGAKGLLESGLEAVVAEVSDVELYRGNATVEQIDEFLGAYGLCRVVLNLKHRHWGDALYVKARLLNPLQRARLRWFGVSRR